MTFSNEFLLQIFMSVGSVVGVYAAIRADLATLHERTKNTADSVSEAHKRIDMIHERRTQ